MGLYSSPPPLLSFTETKPTLLVCWWITIFCFVIVLLRLAGRYIRNELLYTEDRVVSLALIPLFLRMGCVHVILLYGTNNAQFEDVFLTPRDLHRISIGSGLVLASRFFHTATLWIYKVAILEYFKRISDALSERYTDIAVKFIRLALALTFVAVLISDLAECQPFSHYWQVLPDPGGHCRQGYAQLLTLTVCNAFTDLLLVLFPISFILFSSQSVKRKIQLTLLFSLSLGVIGVTVYRAVRVIEQHGSQRLRSLVASVELLFATTAANALVLGSFVRDRGSKRNKFRPSSVTNSLHPSSTSRSRRPTMVHQWGSDEDLVRGLGLGLGLGGQPSFRDNPDLFSDDGLMRPNGTVRMRPAPIVKVDSLDNDAASSLKGNLADPAETRSQRGMNNAPGDLAAWQFPDPGRSGATNSAQSGKSGLSGMSGQSDDDTLLYKDRDFATRANSTLTPRKVSFVDAGGLLNGGSGGSGSAAAGADSTDSDKDSQPTHQTHLSAYRPPRSSSPRSSFPSPAYTAGNQGLHRGSTALLQDLSGFLASSGPPPQMKPEPQRFPTDRQPAFHDLPYQGIPPPASLSADGTLLTRQGSLGNPDDMLLMDAGGLLGGPKRA